MTEQFSRQKSLNMERTGTNEPLLSEVKKLLHHKDTTVGLWATDKPEMIPHALKEEYFFQICF